MSDTTAFPRGAVPRGAHWYSHFPEPVMTGDSISAYDLPERVTRYDADMDIMHPNRYQMIRVALDALPYDGDQPLRALELGTGTGVFTRAFLERFPAARVVSVDGAAAMIELASARLGPLVERVDFRTADFRELDTVTAGLEPCHLVFSSYALHHLDAAEKLEVVRKARESLLPGGWLVNADILVAASPEIEARYQALRVAGIVERAAGRDVRYADAATTRKALDEMEAAEGDRPITVYEDLKILRAAGLYNVSLFWKEYREAVTGGQNPLG